MKKMLVIDNYDSFTYNLVHILKSIGTYTITVIRNDMIDVEEASQFDKIMFSPGPGLPEEAGNMLSIIKSLGPHLPMLGVCLGHQAITENFGGKLENLEKVYHGVECKMFRTDDNCPIFDGIEKEFQAGRYHSWVAEKESFPEELIITSKDEQGEIMSFRHKDLPIYGVQFHPESIMTQVGKKIIENFMNV